MIRHYTIIVANVPAARAAVYGSMAEFQFFGNVVAAAVPLGYDGGVWGMPPVSGNASPLYSWGVWATAVAAFPATVSQLQTLAQASTVMLFSWDDATAETFGQYLARWQTTSGWVPNPAGVAPPTANAVPG